VQASNDRDQAMTMLLDQREVVSGILEVRQGCALGKIA